MGEEFVYKFNEEVTLSLLHNIRDQVMRSFGGFVDFNPHESVSAYRKRSKDLPELEDVHGVELLEVTTKGHLSTNRPPWPEFQNVIERSVELAAIGVVEFLCGFEERNSKQSKHGHDLITISNRRNRLFFCYNANGSQVATEPAYARTFMASMIEILDLPLTLQNKNDHFTLKHTQYGDLKILSALIGEWSPSSFWCELPGVSVETGLEKMKIFLQEFATKKRFAHDWVVRRDYGEAGWMQKEPELSKRIYELLKAAELPASSYDVELELRIADIDGLEVVRSLLGPRDTVFSRLCSFDLPDDNYGEFIVRTSSRGHQLELVLRLPEGLPLVEEALGLQFLQA